MAYRYDPDLEFLQTCSSEELNDLVYLLTHDLKDGETRWTEFLTTNEKYKRYYPEHKQYWQEIAEEIQLFGGNTFMNLFRLGEGVLYKEVLCDVCDKMKVKYDKKSPTREIEQSLMLKILQVAIEKMSPEELKKLQKELGKENLTSFTPQQAYTIFTTIFRMGGFKSYILIRTIVNAIWKFLTGQGLKPVVNAAIGRYLAIFTGPIGWTITGLWTAYDIAGTAYRVTIPAVIQIIYLRSLVENRNAIELADEIKL